MIIDKYLKLIKKLFLLLFLFTISVSILGVGENNNEYNGKIYENIYIENIDIGKMTIKEANEKIKNNYKIKPIKIYYQNKEWIINSNDINLEYDIEKCIEKAYLYTRGEDLKENIKRKFNLKYKNPAYINLNASYDEGKLSSILNEISNEINVSVKDATFTIKDNYQIITTDSEYGKEVDIIKLKEIIYNMINKKQIIDIDLPVNIIKPKISTEDVKSINTVLGQYSTSFNDHTPRGTNIYVAGKSSSDILIMPQEIFSLNKSTGARTWSKGYKTAKVIVGGKYVDGEGGGVCQVSTTIYNAALLAGMEIEEVHNHTYPSKYAPKGRDAAVSYGYTDFKFKNSYSHPIYIKNIVNNGVITSKIYGCKEDIQRLYVKTEQKTLKDKINVRTYRIFLDEENNKIREELVSESKYKIK